MSAPFSTPEEIMRKAALLLAILFAASVPTVADAAKAKRAKAKPVAAAQADSDAALKLVLSEGLLGFVLPAPLAAAWIHEQRKAAAPQGRRARRS
jgi:hypothetical protein